MLYYAAAFALVLVLYFLTGRPQPQSCYETYTQRITAGRIFGVLLPLTILALFRWNVGVDSVYGASYWSAYQAAAAGLNPREFEPLFYLLLRIFSGMRIPFFWFLFFLSLVFMLCVSQGISRGSVAPLWSILTFFLLYFYFDCYSSLRQSLAQAISLIGWGYAASEDRSSKRHLKCLLLFSFAALFHSTAWMNIPIYLICLIHFSQKGLLQFAALGILMTPVFQFVLPFIMRTISGKEYVFLGFARINIIMSFLFFALSWFFYDSIDAVDGNAYLFVNFSLCILIILLNSNVLYLPYRVFDMLKIAYVFIIPYLMKGIRIPVNRFLTGSILLITLIGWFLNSFFLDSNPFREYRTVFESWSTIIRLP